MLAPTPEQYLSSFPPPMQRLAHRVRTLVKRAVPDSTERVKLGWKAINLYVPGKNRPVFFGFIIPHRASVTFGFTFGVLVDEPPGGFLGAEEKLVWARYLSLRRLRDVRSALFTRMIQQAVEAALLPAALRRSMLSRAR
ncbi:MAG: hypothetical protein ACT4QE_17595 [Anaerolineales bacterium]